jgi:hypothetical protein
MKSFSILVVMLSVAFKACSQSFYVEPFYSRSFGINQMFFGTYDELIEFNPDTVLVTHSYNSHEFSMGNGNAFGFVAGKELSDNFSMEIGLSYFKSKEVTIRYSTKYMYIPLSIYNVELVGERYFNAQTFNFFPSFKISANRKKVVTPYFRAGIFVSYNKFNELYKIEIYNNLPGYYPRETYEFLYQYQPNMLFGWYESIGIEFFNDKFINLFAEANYLNLNYIPKYKKCVKHLYQGEDNMHNLESDEEIIYFVDAYSDNDPEVFGKNLRQKFSLSSLSLKVGVKYYF